MRFFLTTVIAGLAATACVSTPAPKNDIQASIRKCGLEGQLRVEIEGNRQLHVRYLDPNVAYPKFDCFMSEVLRLRLDLQIVGNEAVPER